MATYSATTINNPVPAPDCGCALMIHGSYTGTPATGDIWRLAKIPPGYRVKGFIFTNADLGTAAPGDLGYAPVDGSTGSAAAFLDDQAFGTAASNSVNLLATPVTVEKESYLQIVFGTISSGASGAVTVLLLGNYLGAQ